MNLCNKFFAFCNSIIKKMFIYIPVKNADEMFRQMNEKGRQAPFSMLFLALSQQMVDF